MTTEPRYLLIVACSQRKSDCPDLLPAIERYDGGNFRVLRKANRDGRLPETIDVLVLSAKYGLIEASTPISDYEQRMTQKRAAELQPLVTEKLHNHLQENTYDEIYVDLGQDYWPAINETANLFDTTSVIYAKGRIGQRLASLKGWLHSRSQAFLKQGDTYV